MLKIREGDAVATSSKGGSAGLSAERCELVGESDLLDASSFASGAALPWNVHSA